MKQTLLAFALFFSFSGLLQAQDYGEDSVTCRENLYIYYELAKKRQWLDAWQGWNYVYENCPASSKNNFIFGPYIVDAKIDEAAKAGDAAAELKYKKLLMNVYDDRLRYFPEPNKVGYVYARKALDMVKHFPDSSQAAYDLFNQALEKGGQEQSAAFYNYFFVTAARLFNDDVFNAEDVFKAYNLVIEGIEVNNNALNRTIAELNFKRDSTEATLDQKEERELGKAERELDRYNKVASNIEKIVGKIATCDKLGLIYNEETFAANQNDTLWLKRATKMLQKERLNDDGEYEDCTDNPIFFKISDALYKLQPSAPSARAMFVMAYRDGNLSKAVEYIREAIDFEVDPLKRADDYRKLATAYLKMGSLSAANSAAARSAALNPNSGEALLIQAQVYAASEGKCGGKNVVEKKAVYLAAIKKAEYARSIDAGVASRANRLISIYEQQAPSKSVAFQLGYSEGDSYTVGCYINQTVSLKFQ